MGGIRSEIFRENMKIPSVEFACHLGKPIPKMIMAWKKTK